MARNLENIVDLYRYILRKERGAFITLPEVTANLDAGQLDALEGYFKLYGINQEVHDALRPFRVYYQFTTDSGGFVTYPSGYLHILGTAFTVSGSTVNEITFPNEDEWVSAINSQLRPIGLQSPIARDTNTGFSILPQTTQIGFFTYIRRPNTPVYATTQNGRAISFDAGNSVELEWSDVYINNIIAKGLRYAGVNMNEQGISQFAEMYNKETQ